MSRFEPPFSAAAVASAATERAVKQLLRGTTWQAITREIAWRAVVEAGAERRLIASLTPVADASLRELIDGIESRVDAAAVRARRAHLRWRPHDHAGAELAAILEAREQAERLVAAAYVETRSEVEVAARARRQAANVRERRGRRFRRHDRRSTGARLSPIDLGDLGRPHERYGWPRKRTA